MAVAHGVLGCGGLISPGEKDIACFASPGRLRLDLERPTPSLFIRKPKRQYDPSPWYNQ